MAAKPKSKLRAKERYVRVIDKNGDVHEVGSRNAYDLVNHKGWKFEKTEEEEVDEAAHAPRAKKDEKPKGVEAPAERKKRTRRVPAKRNEGPGPFHEEIDQRAHEAVLDDLDALGGEDDEGNE